MSYLTKLRYASEITFDIYNEKIKNDGQHLELDMGIFVIVHQVIASQETCSADVQPSQKVWSSRKEKGQSVQ